MTQTSRTSSSISNLINKLIHNGLVMWLRSISFHQALWVKRGQLVVLKVLAD